MNHSQEIKNAYLRKQRENRRFFAFEEIRPLAEKIIGHPISPFFTVPPPKKNILS